MDQFDDEDPKMSESGVIGLITLVVLIGALICLVMQLRPS